jgi:hypothetical protein
MGRPFYYQVNREVRAQPKPMPPVSGQSNRCINERRGQPLSDAQRDLRTGRAGGGGIGQKSRFMGCAPFDCFWKVRAAWVITVVVQHSKINACVRSFFLYEKALNAGVQEKTHQLVALETLDFFNNLLFFKE